MPISRAFIHVSSVPQPFRSTFSSRHRPLCTTPPPSTNRKHIILLSGGVESSTLLHLSSQTASNPIALFFNYGQRAAEHELRACRAQCKACGISDFLQLDLQAITVTLGSRSGKRRHIPLAHRNATLLGIAASVAGQEQADRICVAICKDDTTWYPSASRAFVEAFQQVGRTLGITIETPLIELGKADVIREGVSIGVNYAETWSCMIGRGGVHCGRCGQCKSRREAMRKVGVDEGKGFYRGG